MSNPTTDNNTFKSSETNSVTIVNHTNTEPENTDIGILNDPVNVFPDDIWHKLSKYCTTVEIFNMCKSNKTFDRHITNFNGEGFEQKITDRLLLDSLERGLERVLRNKFSEYTGGDDITKSLRRMCTTLPPKSVIISGSSIIQAILGVEWKGSDVDIYCTLESAPFVRSWLVNETRMALIDVKARYSQDVVSPFDSDDIGHVEKYGVERMGTVAMPRLNFTIAGNTIEIYAAGGTCIPFLGNVLGAERCKPFSVPPNQEDVNVDLIVVKSGIDITNMIDRNFDMEICKALFDGASFRVPDLQDTIKHKTTLCPTLRNKLSNVYMELLNHECKQPFDSVVAMMFHPDYLEVVGLDDFSFYLKSVYDSCHIFAEEFDKYEDCDVFFEDAFLSMYGADPDELDSFDYHMEQIGETFHDIRIALIRSALMKLLGYVRGLVFESTIEQRQATRFESHLVSLLNDDNRANEDIFRMHNTIVTGVRRWMKYMDRGIEIKSFGNSSMKHIEQEWRTLSRHLPFEPSLLD